MDFNKIKRHLFDDMFVYLYVPLITLLIVVGSIWYYKTNHKCLYGHYENIWYPNYMYDGNGAPILMGGYYQETFICDYRE